MLNTNNTFGRRNRKTSRIINDREILVAIATYFLLSFFMYGQQNTQQGSYNATVNGEVMGPNRDDFRKAYGDGVLLKWKYPDAHVGVKPPSGWTIIKDNSINFEKEPEIDTIHVRGVLINTDFTDGLMRPIDPGIQYVLAEDIGVVRINGLATDRKQREFVFEVTKTFGATEYRSLYKPFHLVNYAVYNITSSSAEFLFEVSHEDWEHAIFSIKKAGDTIDWITVYIEPGTELSYTGEDLEPNSTYLYKIYATKGDEEFNMPVMTFETK